MLKEKRKLENLEETDSIKKPSVSSEDLNYLRNYTNEELISSFGGHKPLMQ